MNKRSSGKLAGLDIGSTKVVCFVADTKDGSIQIKGIGHQLSQGFKGGIITDMKLLENSILSAVHNAEQMADETIDRVFINLSSNLVVSDVVEVDGYVNSGRVTEKDVQRLTEIAKQEIEECDREVIHAVPFDYSLDEINGIADPVGMFGKHLAARAHVASSPHSLIKNISACLAKCHLAIDGIALSSYASALACLNEDELEVGCVVIDMGGGSTSYAIFNQGRMVYVGTIPIGGMHITSDISKVLSTSLATAERVKALYGSTVKSNADYGAIEVEITGGEQETILIPRSKLIEIIMPRAEEIFEMVVEDLKKSKWYSSASSRIILTGGASQLTGARDLAGKIFGSSSVRIGRPKPLTGLADATGSPAFSTCVGLLLAKWNQNKVQEISAAQKQKNSNDKFSSIKKWFAENF